MNKFVKICTLLQSLYLYWRSQQIVVFCIGNEFKVLDKMLASNRSNGSGVTDVCGQEFPLVDFARYYQYHGYCNEMKCLEEEIF